MSYLPFVLSATNLTLATHDRDTHTINIVPLSVRYVINDVIYLADFFMNKTRSNLNYDDTCTLLAREWLEWYQFKGHAHYIDHTYDNYRQLADDLIQKFPERTLNGIIQFDTHTEYSIWLIWLV